MNNLFGYKSETKNSITVKIFCDEIILSDWIYIGALIVPEMFEQSLLQALLNNRCGNPIGSQVWATCNINCPRHNHNDTEIHYREIDKSKDKFFIASKWLDYLLNDRDKVYFYILGINLNRLDKSYFGQQKQQNNIYNRFFRTSILKSVKSYFHPYEKIYIKKICHDSSTSLETDAYFSWHCIFYIDNRDDKIYFKTDKIDFIDSDHRKSSNDYSHFIQFIDLLLGCVYNCIEYASKNPDKEAIAEKCLPLVERLIEKPNNKNSRYNYVGRQKIEFFPKHDLRGLDRDSLEYKFKKRDSFYYKRVLKIKNKDQMTLL